MDQDGKVEILANAPYTDREVAALLGMSRELARVKVPGRWVSPRKWMTTGRAVLEYLCPAPEREPAAAGCGSGSRAS